MAKSASTPEDDTPESLQRILVALIEGSARSIRHRQHQLNSLYNGLLRSRAQLTEALQQDLGLTEAEALFEHSLTLQDIRTCYNGIDMAFETAKSSRLEQGEDNVDYAVPYGIIHIIPSLGMYAVLSPLASAISSGNCVVLALPQTTSLLNGALRTLLIETLSRDTFTICSTQPNQSFLEQCFIVKQTHDDTLPSNSQVIHSPTNGKCVSFVDRDAVIATAARSIFQSRFAFGGKAAYGTDVVFVHEAVMNVFKRQLAQLWIEMSFAGRTFDRKQRHQDRYEAFSTIQVGHQGAIIEMENGSQSLKLPNSTSPTLLLCSMRSSDEGIDMCAELFGSDFPAAAFIFASPKSANYIAQHVEAQTTMINHIPLEALVGPQAPVGSSLAILPRYSPTLFQQKRPQLSQSSDLSKKVGGTVLDNANLTAWAKQLQAPLPTSNEKDDKRVDFFEQAIMTAAGVSLSVIVASTVMGAIWIRKWKR